MTAALSSAPAGLAGWTQRWLDALPAPAGELAPVQERGRQALAELTPPSSRQEDWRFTDLALLQQLPLAGDVLPLGRGPAPTPGLLRLQLDGRLDPLEGVDLPAGLTPLSPVETSQALGHTLAATGCEHHWPVELNHAAAQRVLALRVASRTAVRLELVSAGPLILRLLLVLEEKAELELSQSLQADAPGLTSLVLEAHLGRSARLHHGLVACGHAEAALLAHLAIEQEPESEVRHAAVSVGWGLARLEPRVIQVDGQALTRLHGLQLVEGRQLADTHSHIRFNGPEGQLDQVHKAVASGQGRSVSAAACCFPIALASTPSPSWRSLPTM